MTRRVALVTDSACYIPGALIERHSIIVVPLTVHLDGTELAETAVDLAEFYAALPNAGSVTTSQPSPGHFAEAYCRASELGAAEILSVHIGASVSGTVGSARLGAGTAPVPVTIVDTGQASFAEGLCVLAAAEALERGASVEEAAAAARATGIAVGNTFVVKGLALARRGGRLVNEAPEAAQGIPVMELGPQGMQVVGSATTVEEAVELMAGRVAAAAAVASRPLRVGVGHGAAPQIAADLRDRIASISGVGEIIEYQVGPAVGAHLGAGTAGAVFVPRPLS